MELALALLSILVAVLIGAISPGPSFILVAQTSVVGSSRSGLAAALGMGVGGGLFGVFALVGFQTLLAQAAWLYLALRLLGGAYLIYLAIRLWRGAAEPLRFGNRNGGPSTVVRGPFLLGLATQLSNPKTALVYGSVFTALLPPLLPAWVFLILPLMIFATEASWYAAVALAFSAERARGAYIRFKLPTDRAAGAVMGGLGVKLLVEAVRSLRET